MICFFHKFMKAFNWVATLVLIAGFFAAIVFGGVWAEWFLMLGSWCILVGLTWFFGAVTGCSSYDTGGPGSSGGRGGSGGGGVAPMVYGDGGSSCDGGGGGC